MAQAKYYNLGLFIITGISGSIFTMAFSMLIAKLKLIGLRKVLNYIGQNTLIIFVTQQFFLVIMSNVFSNIKIPSYVELIITTVITLIGGLAIDKLIKLDIWRKR